MSKSFNKTSSQGRKTMLTNIPEIINPGVTIPIYDEDIIDPEIALNQQKIGSYRTRTGKFSNTLSNLLPSISAKLYHSSRKKGSVKTSDPETQSNGGSDMLVDLRDMQATLPKASTKASSIIGFPISPGESIIYSHDMDSLINFPDATSFFLDQSGNSMDSHALESFMPSRNSKSRHNTISSQITSLSGNLPQTAPSSTIWSTNPNTADRLPPNNIQQYNNVNYNINDNENIQTTTDLHITPGTNTYYDQASINGSINLQKPNNTWGPTNNNLSRQRTKSNASSIYIDAATYDQVSRQRATSIYSANQSVQPVPLVADDIDPVSINWVTMDPTVPEINQISNLLPTDTISISNVFSLQQQQAYLANATNLTSTSLVTLCSTYGPVRSARTLIGLNVALVEFISVENAIFALDSLQGKEVSMIGAPSNVYFAKILPMHQQQTILPINMTVPMISENIVRPLLHEQLYNGALSFQQQENLSVPLFNQKSQQQPTLNTSFNQSSTHVTSNEKEYCPFPLPPPTFQNHAVKLEEMINLSNLDYDHSRTNYIIKNALENKEINATNNFGPLPEHMNSKMFDAPKLRELRKIIDANQLSDLEIEQLAMVMLDELPELSSDSLGNTIVQKLFERSSDIIKDIMLRKTSKYLTSMGVHKNGAWACQKMITMANTPRQIKLVTDGVKDYCIPLFNDQFGNYVIQCVLKFGFPWSNFIFENILSNFWVIVQSRYGARAVRACLEASDIVTKEQTLILSFTIVLYADYLTTNSNGTLLVTWFLDTCSLPNRYSILADKLSKTIVELACHKLASLTLLKILNYRGDEHARNSILLSVFGGKEVEEPTEELLSILYDSNHGPTFIYKVLSMTTLDTELRTHAVKIIRKVLLKNPSVNYNRRLMEEVGLAAVGVQTPNTSSRPHGSISHAFNQDTTYHMRQVSTSSAISTGSRHTGVNISNQIAQVNSSPIPITNNNNSSAGYFNYPGMFPNIFSGNSNKNNYNLSNDDPISQLDMLSINNGAALTLPKLSLTNYNNTTTILNPTQNNNN